MKRLPRTAAAALLGGAVLRFLFLGAKSLWFDEASTVLIASRPLGELVPLLVRNEINPPFYYALMHVWLKACPDPRLGLRVFSALCGVAALFAFRGLAERLLPPRARLPALLLAAVSSFWIHAAQDGRSYSLLLLISVLSTRTVLELTEKPTRRLWAAYAALGGLGLLTHYYFAILLAGHAVWLARSRPRWRDYLLAHAAAAALFAPWLPRMAEQARLHLHDPVVGEPLTALRVLDLLGTPFFDVSFLGLALPVWTGVAVGAGLAALALRARVRHRGPFAFCAVHIAAATALVAAVELWSGRPVTQARYFIPLSPVLLLLAASALDGEGAGAVVSRVATAAVLLAGTAGYLFSALAVDPRLDRLAAAIRRSSGPEVPVVHLEKYYYLPMRVYYLPERRNLLLADAAVGMDFRGMPPYPGVIERRELAALGPCVVVDENAPAARDRARLGTGAELARLLGR